MSRKLESAGVAAGDLAEVGGTADRSQLEHGIGREVEVAETTAYSSLNKAWATNA